MLLEGMDEQEPGGDSLLITTDDLSFVNLTSQGGEEEEWTLQSVAGKVSSPLKMVSEAHILKGLGYLFIKVYLIFKYVYVSLWDYVHVSVGTCQGQTRVSDALKLNM